MHYLLWLLEGKPAMSLSPLGAQVAIYHPSLTEKLHSGLFLPSCQVHLQDQVVPLSLAVPGKKKPKQQDNEKTHCNKAKSKIKDITPLAELSRDSQALVAMQLPPWSWLGVHSIKEAPRAWVLGGL